MSTAWDKAKNLAEKHQNQGGLYVRLQNDGDKVVGMFAGEPHAREVYWDGEKYVEATGDGPPPGATSKTPSLRVSINFFVPSEGAMKIVEGGSQWFKDVVQVREKYGLDKWLFEIKRHGKPKDPKTKYTILPEEKIDDSVRAKASALPLHDLANPGSGDADDSDASDPNASNGGRLVDLDVVREIADRLRVLPRANCDEFLAEFKVQRIKDLPNHQVPAALRILGRFEANRAGGNGANAVDPFA